MLRIHALSPAQHREVRHWLSGDDPHLARRAQFVLWSARGWSVPAMAHALGCCRRTVRRWVHAFLDAGLAGVLGRVAAPQKNHHRPITVSAIAPTLPATAERLVPVVPLSVPELRRILAFSWFSHPVSPEFFWHWSIWRRYKQALAMRSHFQKRGTAPPDFAYLRL
jgi:Homeodomain-like domain